MGYHSRNEDGLRVDCYSNHGSNDDYLHDFSFCKSYPCFKSKGGKCIMGFLLLAIFLVLMIIEVPIAFVIGIVALIGIIGIEYIPVATVPMKMVNGLDSFVLLAVPLFILAANLMNSGKISEKLINLALAIVGPIRGGLAHANVLVSM